MSPEYCVSYLSLSSAPGVVRTSGAFFQSLPRNVHSETEPVVLTPNSWPSAKHSNRIASLEGGAVERFSDKTRLGFVPIDAGILDPIVRDQVRQPIRVYVPKVIFKCTRFCQIV